MNPITILDLLLADYASPRVRRLIHALILLVATGYTIYLAADKDWREALITLGAALYAAANKANTPQTDLTSPGLESFDDDGLSYEDAGGADFPE